MYRQFVLNLIGNKNLKVNSNSHLYYYTVLSCYDLLTDELLGLEEDTGVILSGSPTQKVSGEILDEFTPVRHSQMLHEHYGIAPIIIIDEYDTPIHQGYMRNYYDTAR